VRRTLLGFVRQSGGHVKIYSEPHYGTTIKIYLPRFMGIAEELSPVVPVEAAPPGQRHEVVLVVEDEERMLLVSCDAFRELVYAHVSSRARALDSDFQQFVGAGWPTRSFEALVTVVYQYEVRAGWTLQPNFQYFEHPGGGATNPLGLNPGKPLKDAAVLGLRTVLKF
jgi:hypothetical protein